MKHRLFNTFCLSTLVLFGGRHALPQTVSSAAAAAPGSLTIEQASRFAGLALRCVQREFPNKPEHVMNEAADVRGPSQLHPAFYGCYDWHSSVHGHWMLVRLLRLFPALPEARQMRAALDQNLSADNIRAEAAYLSGPNRQSFERTYGWVWLLKLAEELHSWKDGGARKWSRNLQPLADALVMKYREFLPKQTYPIRTGVHPNSAFGLAFALDYARAVGDRVLEQLIRERSMAYFGKDTDYPASWEPGGEDFLSPALTEADLMRRVLEPVQFRTWFNNFLPGFSFARYERLLTPARVSDRSDPKLVHLDGLNLSRAWCMRSLAAAFEEGDATRKLLLEGAERHAQSALAYVAGGDYAGEHWLASFAVYLLTSP
jgi:hypothetical protein